MISFCRVKTFSRHCVIFVAAIFIVVDFSWAENIPPPRVTARTKLTNSPRPLERLIFSARTGFLLRMNGNEDVTAEIRNGAGRVLAHSTYALQAGDWKLHPKNLAPGLYTVLLRTGSNLRSMRMKIEDVERGPGTPKWVLEKAPSDTSATSPLNAPTAIQNP